MTTLATCFIRCGEPVNTDDPNNVYLPDYGWAHATCIEADTYAAQSNADVLHDWEDDRRGFL